MQILHQSTCSSNRVASRFNNYLHINFNPCLSKINDIFVHSITAKVQFISLLYMLTISFEKISVTKYCNYVW